MFTRLKKGSPWQRWILHIAFGIGSLVGDNLDVAISWAQKWRI
jgi:hypothetical protein